MSVLFSRLLSRQLAVLTALVLGIAVLLAVPVTAEGRLGHTRWSCLAHYESTHRWHINTGNGYYGGLQFSRSTWRYYGGPSYSNNRWPHKASRAEQIVIAKRVAWKGWKGRPAQGGRNAWPNTWSGCRR
jgi:hypothetical protein